MANIIIKSDAQRAHENIVLKSYGAIVCTAEQKECAQEISRRTAEIESQIRKEAK